ncbi:MAG: tetratricopeptide repeat protein [Pirellulales bacterium]
MPATPFPTPANAATTAAAKPTALQMCSRSLLLVALTLVAYHNSFAGKMAFDDYRYLGEDKFEELTSFAEDSKRPILFWSLALNYRLGGSNAFGYHAFNLAVHLLAALCLFGLVRRTLQSPACRARFTPDATLNLAFVIALLWAVHPLATQAVTYIIQRTESLASLFYAASIYGVSRAAGEVDSRARRSLWGLFSIAMCWLGFGSKEIAATIPIAAILYDRIYFAGSWRELVRRRAWIYLGQLAPLAWFIPLLGASLFRPGTSLGFGMKAISPWAYALNQPAVILHYLRLAFWPHPLCLDYVWQPAAHPAKAILPSVILVGLLAATTFGVWRLRIWSWPAAAFFLILAPTSSFIPIADLAFEHRMYLPLAVVVSLTVVFVAWITSSWRDSAGWRRKVVGALPVLVALLAVAAIARTIVRNADYADPERLWLSVIAVSPHNPRAHSNLGGIYYHRGDFQRAARSYFEAARLLPTNYDNLFGLAISLTGMGRHEDAVRCYRRGLELRPNSTEAHNDLGVSYERMGDLSMAEQSFRRALELAPDFPVAARNLGALLLQQGRDVEALPLLEQALASDPRSETARRHVAWLLATTRVESLRDPGRALTLLEGGADHPPATSARSLDAIAAAQAALGRFDLALDQLEKALMLAQERRLDEYVAEITTRRELYRRRQPFIRSGP